MVKKHTIIKNFLNPKEQDNQIILSEDSIAGYLNLNNEFFKIDSFDNLQLDELKGGIINKVFKLTSGNQVFILKQAFDKAKSILDCPLDRERLTKEFEAIKIFRELSGIKELPEISFIDRVNNVLVIHNQLKNPVILKDNLVNGRVNKERAGNIARILANMHNSTKDNKMIRSLFDNTESFFNIKVKVQCIDITEDPKLKKKIIEFLSESLKEKTVLLHGDIAPKNILFEDDELLFIDMEESDFGDPALDVGYLIAHYYLYSLLNTEKIDEYYQSIKTIFDTYTLNSKSIENLEEFENNVVKYIGIFMLSRIDGKAIEPEIQKDILKKTIRNVSNKLISENYRKIEDVNMLIHTELSKVKNKADNKLKNSFD